MTLLQRNRIGRKGGVPVAGPQESNYALFAIFVRGIGRKDDEPAVYGERVRIVFVFRAAVKERIVTCCLDRRKERGSRLFSGPL